MATQMRQRRGTAAEWSAANPILAAGEVGVELDTGVMKSGDGVLRWNALPVPYVLGINGSIATKNKDVPALTVKGFTNQQADILRITDVDGNVLSRFDKSGIPYLGSSPLLTRAAGDDRYDAKGATPALVDAKGDLLVGSADNTLVRLPKGTDGQILEARTSEASGLKWRDAPGPPVMTQYNHYIAQEYMSNPYMDGVLQSFNLGDLTGAKFVDIFGTVGNYSAPWRAKYYPTINQLLFWQWDNQMVVTNNVTTQRPYNGSGNNTALYPVQYYTRFSQLYVSGNTLYVRCQNGRTNGGETIGAMYMTIMVEK